MSVYIKGFPLPNNCGACPLRLAWCRERIYMVTRPERCPLVPVQTHGRLIDADALKDAIDSADWYHQAPNKEMAHGANSAEHQAWYKEQDIYSAIDDAPTITPADKAGEG